MRGSNAVGLVYINLAAVIVLMTISIEARKKFDCPITSTNVTELKEPIFLRNTTGKFEFYLPKNGSFGFIEKEQFLVFCPNPKNILINSNANITLGQCTNGKFKVAGTLYDSLELQCNKSIRGDVKKNNSKCGNNQGSSAQIGYYIGRQRDFLPLIEICYDHNKDAALYSEHILYGDSIKKASRTKFRPNFSTLGLNSGVSVTFKQVFQKATFTKLLGSSELAEKYINTKSYLSRGHLSPDADFLFAPWQYSTYFYINVCPQWQVVNGGNWVKVESMVRKTSSEVKEPLRIFTGTHDLLQLPHQNGTFVGIYLLPNSKLPVPKFIWKLVYRPSTKQAIVIISLNNPFLTNIMQDDYLCKDVCADYGWENDNWKTLDKGLIFCCEYKTFIENVGFVPKIQVKSPLQGPKRH